MNKTIYGALLLQSVAHGNVFPNPSRGPTVDNLLFNILGKLAQILQENKITGGYIMKEEGSKIHEALQMILSKEIVLRQEILGNMNQQEYVLLIGDKELKEELHIECNKLVKSLMELIKQRGILTRKLFDNLPPKTHGKTLDEVLNPLQEVEAETLLLYQKAKMLIEKIHGQHLRIKTLQDMILQEGPLSVDNGALHSERKGPTLITIDYPPEKKEK